MLTCTALGSAPPPLVLCTTTAGRPISVHVSATEFHPYEEVEGRVRLEPTLLVQPSGKHRLELRKHGLFTSWNFPAWMSLPNNVARRDGAYLKQNAAFRAYLVVTTSRWYNSYFYSSPSVPKTGTGSVSVGSHFVSVFLPRRVRGVGGGAVAAVPAESMDGHRPRAVGHGRLENIPQTISISYSTEERLMSREYAMNVCDQFAKLGVRGVSVLVSSGNDAGTCMRDDGTVRFDSDFPGTCPHVTVVGGTTDFEPEVAASFSGGGFSDYFKRPTYQEEAVASGRGIPDIAGAQAIGLPIFFNDNKKTVSGTSAAAPDPLGFLNHWLYGKGSRGLTDITEGSNPGCMLQGFSAIAGWDPVTGLGTPKFRKMLEQLL
ncbi:peptidase S8/S53 domain-containing protein, partial [Lactarius hatsudake]